MTTTLPVTHELALSLDEHVLSVVIDRAAQHNTVTYAVLDELLEVFAFADVSDAVRAVVVSGAGDCFSYGTDLRAGNGFAVGSGAFKPLRGGRRDIGGELSIAIYNSRHPVIAALHGTAVGIGVSMVLPMDIRIAEEGTRFALPFVRRGIIPESCASWFLPRIVGIATALQWSMTGAMFDADEAHARGLVQELVPRGTAVARAHEIAHQIARRSAPVSVALTRHLMWRGLSTPHPMTANELESEALLHLGAGPDAVEGVASFLERRDPDFPTPATEVPPPYPWWDEPHFAAPEG